MTIDDFKKKIIDEYNFKYINDNNIHKFYGDFQGNHIIIIYDEKRKNKIKLAMSPANENLSEDEVKEYPFNLNMIDQYMKMYG